MLLAQVVIYYFSTKVFITRLYNVTIQSSDQIRVQILESQAKHIAMGHMSTVFCIYQHINGNLILKLYKIREAETTEI